MCSSFFARAQVNTTSLPRGTRDHHPSRMNRCSFASGAFSAAGSAQAAWNCSASVEPAKATVSALGEIAEVTRSK